MDLYFINKIEGFEKIILKKGGGGKDFQGVLKALPTVNYLGTL